MRLEEADGPLRHGNRAAESGPLGAKCATGCVCTEKGVKWTLFIVKIHLDGKEYSPLPPNLDLQNNSESFISL